MEWANVIAMVCSFSGPAPCMTFTSPTHSSASPIITEHWGSILIQGTGIWLTILSLGGKIAITSEWLRPCAVLSTGQITIWLCLNWIYAFNPLTSTCEETNRDSMSTSWNWALLEISIPQTLKFTLLMSVLRGMMEQNRQPSETTFTLSFLRFLAPQQGGSRIDLIKITRR